jgi:hypothetical protein
MKQEVIEGDVEFLVDTEDKIRGFQIIRKNGQVFTALKVK